MSRTLRDAQIASLTAEDLDCIWQHQQRQYDARRGGEPELYDAACQLVADAEAAGRLDPLVADAIRHDLASLRPSVVLGCYWRELIADRPALGSFVAREVLANAA